ncbi:ABC transporter substrate-binding protein [Aquibacillus salsiterrae]|uniref:Extracellular solute-binding protein n=1 Tax=Aquibacillus salsiterrae TaxID=2950439 RepID=A0A9X3WBS5_9BACI|nr:extracellular solute-binding protein [Aquibacillus salsiterrae]MDC3416780.1 extracellular solute-binding protein [Aquibacillus salsiterrae]
MLKKKYWLAVLAVFLMIGILVGCNSEGDDTASSAESDDTSTEQINQEDTGQDQADQEEEVTIKFYTFGNEADYNWSETIGAFEESNPNINVDLIVLSEKGDTQEAMQKLDLAAASGEKMDVLMFSDPAGYAERVSLGMVAPIDEFIDAEGYKVEEEYKVNTILNGQYYALPGKFNPWYVLVNKDQLAEANLEVPTEWTWEEFMDYAKQLTTDERYGTYFHGPQGGGWMEYLKLALSSKNENSGFIKADGTQNFGDPMFRKTLEMRLQMEKEDQSATPYTDILSQKLHYRTQFFNQDASLVLIGSWMNTQLGGTDQFPLNFEVGIAPYPTNEGSGESGYTPVTTDYMSVASNSENKEAAYKFIRWYTTEGQIVQGKNIPSWNGVSEDDFASIVDTILSDTNNPEKVDKDSLINVLKNSKASKLIPPVAGQAEIYEVVQAEYEKLIYGEQDIDTTIENLEKQAAEILESN